MSQNGAVSPHKPPLPSPTPTLASQAVSSSQSKEPLSSRCSKENPWLILHSSLSLSHPTIHLISQSLSPSLGINPELAHFSPVPLSVVLCQSGFLKEMIEHREIHHIQTWDRRNYSTCLWRLNSLKYLQMTSWKLRKVSDIILVWVQGPG